jgi:glycosyltransferase involved in cell wall biosynthesis
MEKVRFIDYIPTRDLPLLYNAAEVFVFPSLYEGFGLPPLESMKCGTPVIVSNRSSLPEIVGPLGLMVAPDDIKKICSLILKIVNDRSYRDQLSEYYLQYASNFSWEKCAQKTYDIYQELLYND